MEQLTGMLVSEELEELVLSRKFLDEELDRLLGWEMLRRALVGKMGDPMHPSEFCDTIGVGPRYTNRVLGSIKRKTKTCKTTT